VRRQSGIVAVTGLGRPGGVDKTGCMKPPSDPHCRHRFPAAVISQAVWLYHMFSLSLRDVELLLAERGLCRHI
jgi:putative transposase